MNKYYLLQFADSYNTGAYGACTYNSSTGACTTGTGSSTNPGTSSGSGSGLVNTGFIVLVIVTAACLLIFAALAVRLWRRPRKLAEQPVEAETSSDDDQPRSDDTRQA